MGLALGEAKSVISDLDIRRAAQATIDQYGDGAGLHAAQRADELLTVGAWRQGIVAQSPIQLTANVSAR